MRAVIAVIVVGLLATTTVSGELPARAEHVAKQARSRGDSPRSLLAASLAPQHDVAWAHCDRACLSFWTSDGTSVFVETDSGEGLPSPLGNGRTLFDLQAKRSMPDIISWTSGSRDPGSSFSPDRCSQFGLVIPTRPTLVTHGRPGIRMLYRPNEHPRLAAMP
jgi:hypothetical protein